MHRLGMSIEELMIVLTILNIIHVCIRLVLKLDKLVPVLGKFAAWVR